MALAAEVTTAHDNQPNVELLVFAGCGDADNNQRHEVAPTRTSWAVVCKVWRVCDGCGVAMVVALLRRRDIVIMFFSRRSWY